MRPRHASEEGPASVGPSSASGIRNFGGCPVDRPPPPPYHDSRVPPWSAPGGRRVPGRRTGGHRWREIRCWRAIPRHGSSDPRTAFPCPTSPSCTVGGGATLSGLSGPPGRATVEARDTTSTLRKESDRLRRILHRVPRRWLPPCPSWWSAPGTRRALFTSPGVPAAPESVLFSRPSFCGGSRCSPVSTRPASARSRPALQPVVGSQSGRAASKRSMSSS